MSTESRKRSDDPAGRAARYQPFDKAAGILAACAVVAVGAWIGLRPGTILIRALVVGAATSLSVQLLMTVVRAMLPTED